MSTTSPVGGNRPVFISKTLLVSPPVAGPAAPLPRMPKAVDRLEKYEPQRTAEPPPSLVEPEARSIASVRLSELATPEQRVSYFTFAREHLAHRSYSPAALSAFRTRQALAAHQAFHDTDPAVKNAALQFLATQPAPGARAVLGRMMLGERPIDDRRMAARAMSQLVASSQDPVQAKAFVELLRETTQGAKLVWSWDKITSSYDGPSAPSLYRPVAKELSWLITQQFSHLSAFDFDENLLQTGPQAYEQARRQVLTSCQEEISRASSSTQAAALLKHIEAIDLPLSGESSLLLDYNGESGRFSMLFPKSLTASVLTLAAVDRAQRADAAVIPDVLEHSFPEYSEALFKVTARSMVDTLGALSEMGVEDLNNGRDLGPALSEIKANRTTEAEIRLVTQLKADRTSRLGCRWKGIEGWHAIWSEAARVKALEKQIGLFS